MACCARATHPEAAIAGERAGLSRSETSTPLCGFVRIDDPHGFGDAPFKVAKNKKAAVMIRWNGRVVARAGHLRNLLHDCVTSHANEQAMRLVEAARLLRCDEDVAAVKAMVAIGAYESAACIVLGPNRPFLLSRSANNVCLASTVIACGEYDTGRDEATGEAATPALAILAALASALLAEDSRARIQIDVRAPASRLRLH